MQASTRNVPTCPTRPRIYVGSVSIPSCSTASLPSHHSIHIISCQYSLYHSSMPCMHMPVHAAMFNVMTRHQPSPSYSTPLCCHVNPDQRFLRQPNSPRPHPQSPSTEPEIQFLTAPDPNPTTDTTTVTVEIQQLRPNIKQQPESEPNILHTH